MYYSLPSLKYQAADFCAAKTRLCTSTMMDTSRSPKYQSTTTPTDGHPSTAETSRKGGQMYQIDAGIAQIEDAIVMLVKQRATLKKRRNALAPAVNLPPEILSYIFELACVPSDAQQPLFEFELDVGGGERSMRRVLTPLFIGEICSQWRDVAWSASQLWTSITVRLCDKRVDSQVSLLRHWLTRSANRPLKIKLIEDETEDDNDDEWGIDVTSTAVIDVLAAHSHQWQTLDTFLPYSWKTVLSRIRHNLPLLTTLTLRVAEGSPTLGSVNLFLTAPLLRNVTLVGYSIADVDLPWGQLERVVGEYFSAGECLETLRLCPNLRLCQFEQLYRGFQPSPIQPIHHPNLESFELMADSTFELQPFFGTLTLPALKELVLSLPDDVPFLRFVTPVLSRSGCALRLLHLVGVMPPEDDLIQALEALPSLTTLYLINPVVNSGSGLTDRFLKLLHPRAYKRPLDGDMEGVRGVLLPKLKDFEYRGVVHWENGALVDLLERRWGVGGSEPEGDVMVHGEGPNPARVVAQLMSFVLTNPWPVQLKGDEVARVQTLREEGMKIVFDGDPGC